MKAHNQGARNIGLLLLGVVLLLGSGCGSEGDGAGHIAAASQNGVCSKNNTCPVADAGPNQTVLASSLVTLDGSQSAATPSGLLTYQWTLTAKPTGSTATLVGDSTVRPTFTADLAGDYNLQLVVTTIDGSSRSNVVVTAGTGNLAPLANAGPDQKVPPSVIVHLDGSGSHDPNGTALASYSWKLTAKPGGSTAALSDQTIAKPTFYADMAGTYKFHLTVSDATLLTSAPANVEITAVTGNIAPVANAGPDQTTSAGSVTLNGYGSFDPNRADTLTFSWSVTSTPAGSTIVTVTNPTTVTPTFTPDVDGFYVLALVVQDGTLSSLPDVVVIQKTQSQPRFTVVPGSNNEAVQDNTTNLVWERVPGTGHRIYGSSVTYCYDKTVGGKDDWRLPSLVELSSLISPTAPPCPTCPLPPTVPSPPFVPDVNAFYWTTTENMFYGPDYRALVQSSNGAVGYSHVSVPDFSAWCVRG